MKKMFLTCAVLLCSMAVASAQHPGTQYRLKKVIPVEGRQGIAADAEYYYVSGSKALYKYDKTGKLLMENKNPFTGLKKPANHIGDIDVWKGELYCGMETFVDGHGTNIQVAVFDAKTLKFKRSLAWEPASGQVECSGLAVDRLRNMVWMSDWVDSRYVYCYSLETGKYYTKMQCHPTPYWCQGITIADDTMLFTADDGESTWQIPDCVYSADISNVTYSGLTDDGIAAGAMDGRVKLLRAMTDFRRAGEIEGLSIDPSNDDLIVLNNRGVQILLGMPKGPFTKEGYTKEIHELYVYEKIK
ncbi:MAG: hypothetical protein LKI53_07985 [Bacteroidales bacterium]|jgi:hypothetical protein|nr:hypothetical protein [Bacteroidales bacterium]